MTSFGNKFCLKKRSGLINALDNRLYVKFMQLEIGLLDKKICPVAGIRSLKQNFPGIAGGGMYPVGIDSDINGYIGIQYQLNKICFDF